MLSNVATAATRRFFSLLASTACKNRAIAVIVQCHTHYFPHSFAVFSCFDLANGAFTVSGANPHFSTDTASLGPVERIPDLLIRHCALDIIAGIVFPPKQSKRKHCETANALKEKSRAFVTHLIFNVIKKLPQNKIMFVRTRSLSNAFR